MLCIVELRTTLGSFELAPDTEVSLVEINNALDWNDSFNQERSYPFTLPWTDTNARIWLNADAPETYDNPLSVPCDLIVAGNLEFRGRVYLLKTEFRKSYTATLTYDKNAFDSSKLIGEITPIAYTEYSDENTAYMPFFDMDNIAAGNAPFTLPVLKQKISSFDYINHWDIAPAPEYTPGGPCAPMFKLIHLLDLIAAEMGLLVKGSFLTDDDLKKLIIFNVHYYFVAIIVSGPTYEIGFLSEPKLKDCLPKISIAELFNCLRIKFGLSVSVGTNYLYFYTLRDILQRKKTVDLTRYVKAYEPMDIKPEQAAEYRFKQGFDNSDGLNEYIRNVKDYQVKGTVPFEFALYSITGPAVGDVYLVTETDWYFAWDGSTWKKYAWKYAIPFDTGENPKEINEISSTVITSLEYDAINPADWKVPQTEYSVDDMERNVAESELRFLLYHGMQDSKLMPLSISYPFASHDSIDSNGVSLGNLDLREEGDNGLYKRYKTYRRDLLQNRKAPVITFKNDVPIKDLKPDVLVRIKANDYMWQEKTRTYNMRGLDQVELKLIKA